MIKRQTKRNILLNLFLSSAFLFSVSAHDDDLLELRFLPGEKLYFLSTFPERLMTFFTFSENGQISRHFYLATKRLAEAKELALDGDTNEYSGALANYDKELQETRSKLLATEKNNIDDKVLNNIDNLSVRHISNLKQIQEVLDGDERDSVTSYIESATLLRSKVKEYKVKTK